MPLLRHTKLPTKLQTKLPPAPEIGQKTLWQSLPRQSTRRVLFLLIALGAVLFLKATGGGSFGGLLDAVAPPPGARRAGADDAAPSYHLKVARPADAPAAKSTP
jgi:hypothetical protein